VFKSWFSKKKPALEGRPATRRLKTYAAGSGYVYHYYYEGHRNFRGGGEQGVEYVFSVSGDGKNWMNTSVFAGEALRGWEQAHGRELSSTERYAVAKLALFQAFDERAAPEQMKREVRLRSADVEAIIETLDL
jgi:hypothetical protein